MSWKPDISNSTQSSAHFTSPVNKGLAWTGLAVGIILVLGGALVLSKWGILHRFEEVKLRVGLPTIALGSILGGIAGIALTKLSKKPDDTFNLTPSTSKNSLPSPKRASPLHSALPPNPTSENPLPSPKRTSPPHSAPQLNSQDSPTSQKQPLLPPPLAPPLDTSKCTNNFPNESWNSFKEEIPSQARQPETLEQQIAQLVPEHKAFMKEKIQQFLKLSEEVYATTEPSLADNIRQLGTDGALAGDDEVLYSVRQLIAECETKDEENIRKIKEQTKLIEELCNYVQQTNHHQSSILNSITNIICQQQDDLSRLKKIVEALS